MKIFNHIHKLPPFGLKPWGLLLLSALCTFLSAQAQITIGGNVYGGGDKAVVSGNTSVQVISGNMEGSVFGGARMADVKGNVYVDIDGITQGQVNYIVANRVYGGNDISGKIGENKANAQSKVPANLTDSVKDGINSTWDAFVHISNAKVNPGTENESDLKQIYIGQLFGGGNGEYAYSIDSVVKNSTTTYTHAIRKYNPDGTAGDTIAKKVTTDKNDAGFNVPDLGKTYLDIHGGSIVYAYGGGNKATVTGQTVICVDNNSDVVNSIDDVDGQTPLLTPERFRAMGVYGYPQANSNEYQIGRFFGGNNLAEMKIRPRWNLESGSIRNVYSGGNRGDMTHVEGLLLEIADSSTIVIDNLFGGSRMADVHPLKPGTREDATPGDIQITEKDNQGHDLYKFPAGLAARVLVRGGDINNVYGGNDITGHVTGGNAVGIYTKIRGNVYGGGNGSYPYTDNENLNTSESEYYDYYYNPDTVLTKAGYSTEEIAALGDLKSAKALNLFRPDAEQVSIHLIGTQEKPTVISGSLYLGGNSATISTTKLNPRVELKMGSYVIADKVFLGNNGEEMVKSDAQGVLRTMNTTLSDGTKHNNILLTDSAQFAEYMEGAAMNLIPTVSFDSRENGDRSDYVSFSSYIGSFFCGGNRGSMTYPGTNNMDMSASLVAFDKIVGGCNDAFIEAVPGINAEYRGGILGAASERTETNGKTAFEGQNRLVLNFNGVKLEPKRWALKRDNQDKYIKDDNGKYIQDVDSLGQPYLEWNTVQNEFDDNGNIIPVYYTDRTWAKDAYASDEGRRLDGANIYGGCHESGIVNGNVVININDDLVDKSRVFAQDQEVEGEDNSYIITARPGSNGWRSGVILYDQAYDVLSITMTVFGGGYGEKTEIWGSTNINLNDGYTFQIFGGGLSGVIGKKDSHGEYYYDPAYSTTVALNGEHAGYSPQSTGSRLAETEYIYGAGNEGDVCGNSHVYLGNGRIYDAFGGASDADILGHSETYIGYADGFPWVRDIVYGGNDFGGEIHGLDSTSFWGRVRESAKSKVYGYDPAHPDIIPERFIAPAYVEYTRGWIDTIFGGNFGNYAYHDSAYFDSYFDEEGDSTVYVQRTMPYIHSTFVNIRPETNVNNSITAIFGGSTGFLGNRDGDKSQDHSYVLIDIPDGTDNFQNTEIFGAGSFSGMGMRKTVLPMKEVTDVSDPKYQQYQSYLKDLEESSAVIDLASGKIGAVYGGSFNEGVTRRTLVNVPDGSTINVGSIFGGAYGNVTLSPCDVYEAHVEYHSQAATLRYNPPRIVHKDETETLIGYNPEKIENVVLNQGETYLGNILEKGAIYGGNNFRRRTLYSKINIDVKLNQQSYKYGSTTGYIYGAGCGEFTWSEYTEINLNNGAQVWEVYGGGQDGLVINAPSIQKYINYMSSAQGVQDFKDPRWEESWILGGAYDDCLHNEFTDEREFTNYVNNEYTNLTNPLVTPRLEFAAFGDTLYNTNVIINQGAYVGNYAYGGGLGSKGEGMEGSGDVYGSTYIALLGGTVNKDLYAAGTTGGVYDAFGVGPKTSNNPNGFTASTTAYIEGGTARNVYGGGWEGNVGLQDPDNTNNDIPGITNVVIGIRDELASGLDFYHGVPAIQRNAYAGGEGGSVIGSANITVNNGYIGYAYLVAGKNFGAQGKVVDDNTKLTAWYAPKIDDETYFENGVWKGLDRLNECGNVFGSGYDDLSTVDKTYVTIYGGNIRNSVFGGGEIATVGRGSNENNTISIYKAGETNINMYNGNVLRNVFGAGKGYNSLGYGGTHKLHTDGYVFGQTRVNIHGGVIGSADGIELGYGNVFGGGDRGYVYSAYEYYDEDDSEYKLGKGVKSGVRYDDSDEGFYYKHEDGSFKTKGGEKIMTEDCRVVVEPWLQVTADNGITYDGIKYNKWDYIPTSYLNTLPGKPSDKPWGTEWNGIDAGSVEVIPAHDNQEEEIIQHERGIVIYNAVFAGGNVSSGGDMSAHSNTVFGNATASIHDVYNRDFVTIGTGRTGGLYGDGNLTFVDGYREINITNYGTDFYHIDENIDISGYKVLPKREQAYYELKYKCLQPCTDVDGTTYSKGSTIPQEQLYALFYGVNCPGTEDPMINGEGKPDPRYWVENGVLLRAPGRSMNTVQRADFCGVFGSRMVMQGAQDRVPETVDYTNYTINRVREVSLNKKETAAQDTIKKNLEHGNYFGIYSVVNYLGALTSDVDFDSTRVTDNKDKTYHPELIEGTETPVGDDLTYSAWKKKYIKERKRNNGSSYNKVALASGVYLELTTEQSTGTEFADKDWGYITGIIELDLINVSTGMGGGFVYAKNVHGERKTLGKKQVILSNLNKNAVTKKNFDYSAATADDEMQSSGNFVHSTQTIIDDCYNISGRYYHDGTHDSVSAHYWFIKGQIYVYDQIISAYTGAPNAYRETSNIPLTISAGANGKMKLLDIQPNLYAYYSSVSANGDTKTPLTPDNKLVINDVTYRLNDPISYWDWQNLSKTEQMLFVNDTYIVLDSCKVVVKQNNTETTTQYYAGQVLLPDVYNSIKPGSGRTTDVIKLVNRVEKDTVDFNYEFRSSNNVSHDNGYILTYTVNNPPEWDTWFTPKTGLASAKIDSINYKELIPTEKENYHSGPTYTPRESGLYGQRLYGVADIIPEEDSLSYDAAWKSYKVSAYYSNLEEERKSEIEATQAHFERAYLTTEFITATDITGTERRMQQGAKLAKSEYSTSVWNSIQDKVTPAFICTSTIRISQNEYITAGDLLTQAQINAYLDTLDARIARDQSQAATLNAIKQEITGNNSIVNAYYNTRSGYYGGDYYVYGNNYRALNAWSSMPAEFRNNFKFNYDALDLLIDPSYSHTQGSKFQYDDSLATQQQALANKAHYSLPVPVDYTAKYNGTTDLKYLPEGATDSVNAKVEQYSELSRVDFENLLNEQSHYVMIDVSKAGTYYVVNTSFVYDELYAIGDTISSDNYQKLVTNNEQEKLGFITPVTFNASQVGKNYFCYEPYTIDATYGKPVKSIINDNTISSGVVPVGFVIAQGENEGSTYCYSSLPNLQRNFTIHGKSPTETSTLYVSRNSDIHDLSKEKIITVIYQYDYTESDESGLNITPISERHVVNIHLQFKSGIPTVTDITSPDIVLPGNSLMLKTPTVTPGAYEIIGEGWELFEDDSFAESHTNGNEYKPTSDSLYWYQNGYYIAYYAKTYLGKTYSNYVPISVANYHDLKKVMDDKRHHLHVDYDHNKLKGEKKNAKIYINNYTGGKDGIDLLKEFYDLSVTSLTANVDDEGIITSGTFQNHAKLNARVLGGKDLDFILRTNINHTDDNWTPIGDNTYCFDGTFHGDGFTISGLDNSLFGSLCGSVYNLGVTGSFTSAGVADTGDGYVENCWISTTGTPDGTVYAVFGYPSNQVASAIQIVNSYYPNTLNYNTAQTQHGIATPMPAQSFYNGEVAYNLNGFYLNKRYYDGHGKDHNDDYYTAYRYIDPNEVYTSESNFSTGYYPSSEHVSDYAAYGTLGYVEERYRNGDFRYSGGSIPTSADTHLIEYVEDNEHKTQFVPVWPDDYIFFGQNLSLGYDNRVHNDQPAHYNGSTNRVYRAPAYYGNSKVDVAYFNAAAILPATVRNSNRVAYKGMTALDLTGANGDLSGGYHQGTQAATETAISKFYAPLLDYSTLSSFRNDGQTQNMLVYINQDDETTANIINTYFQEPEFEKYANVLDNGTPTDDRNPYGSIRKISGQDSTGIHGHLVLLDVNGYHAATSQFLVDKQDFNAPISYKTGEHSDGNGHYTTNVIWYQRQPGVFVKNAGTGWESISLPFTAKEVTTTQKGIITHFYQGGSSDDSHEYWLRTPNKIDSNDPTKILFKAIGGGNGNETGIAYSTTFMWDYYYKNTNGHNQKDKNGEDYQRYYDSEKTYSNYPYASKAQPYLIGFPGDRYYEFDMSGQFIAQNTAANGPAQLGKQTITFVSGTDGEVTIGVSDLDYQTESSVSGGNYVFKPTYQEQNLDGSSTWLLNGTDVTIGGVTHVTGTAFCNDEQRTTVKTVPFRAYITETASGASGAPKRVGTRAQAGTSALFIDYSGSQDQLDERAADAGLTVYTDHMNICVESYLEYDTQVTIYTSAGKQLKKFTIQPGTRVTVPVNNRGIYIVNRKKVAVTR